MISVLVNNMWLSIGITILVILFIVAVFLVYRDTTSKSGRWGVNFSPMNNWKTKLFSRRLKFTDTLADVCCPNCGYQLPKVRTPESLKQALWGGWTCKQCGAEVNKWGKLDA